MMNLLVDLRMRIDTLVLCVQAAINSGFPMRAVDNLFTAEEPFQALPACLGAIVIEAIRQGAAAALAAVQL